eukprot:COSAG02_NODE_34323_length_485_cov_249.917098_1_plen_102_part_01
MEVKALCMCIQLVPSEVHAQAAALSPIAPVDGGNGNIRNRGCGVRQLISVQWVRRMMDCEDDGKLPGGLPLQVSSLDVVNRLTANVAARRGSRSDEKGFSCI